MQTLNENNGLAMYKHNTQRNGYICSESGRTCRPGIQDKVETIKKVIKTVHVCSVQVEKWVLLNTSHLSGLISTTDN